MTSPARNDGLSCFISYSHKDKWALERLCTHMAMLKRDGLINEWYDREILAGDDIDRAILEKLNSCDLFLALVSPDFLASDYCYETEMARALERHDANEARVVPIIIEPCEGWQKSPLGRLKALPEDGKPISEWENENAAFKEVAEELRRILTADLEEKSSVVAPEPEPEAPVPVADQGDFRARRTITEQLYDLLNFIAENSRKLQGIRECRNAYNLFLELEPEIQRIRARRLFDVLDRPMKVLGDKRLVLEVAEKCIEVTNHSDREDEEAECEARARICGTSWAYQRIGKLDRAADEAKLSMELSELMNLSKNLAFCHKCNGRLARLRAEETGDRAGRGKFLEESVAELSRAIDMFSHHEEFGPEHPEVGDCHSLLARTFLFAHDVAEAKKHVEKASGLLADDESKDYFDLQIVIGDIAARGLDMGAAHTRYTAVIDRGSGHDYQMSEIVARACMQRGKLYARKNDKEKAASDFTEAAAIWERYDEKLPVAEAKWEAVLVTHDFPRPVLRLLEPESPEVKVAAFGLFEGDRNNASGTHTSLAQRGVHDATIWKRKLKQARKNLALKR